MNAMPLVITAIAIFVLVYRFYFSFIAAKVLTLYDSRGTPSGRLFDGQNYYPMSKWVLFGHHFAIMFEALFILTTIDAGTRIGRFILQESLGKIYKPFARTNWLPGNLFAIGIVVVFWGYFIYTESVSTIWPMFGTANQLLATIALTIGTSYIINRGKIRYAWVTIVPLVFVGITTFTAGILNMKGIYIPQLATSAHRVDAIINLSLTLIIMASVVIILRDAVPGWVSAWKIHNKTRRYI
jgi:carbon starvation protein